jgi:PAS domain S-box-containing protein
MASTDSTARILIVDDRPANLVVLETLLEPLGHPIYQAHNGAEALKLLLQYDFAVILLDVQLPDINGFEAAALIKEREKTRHIPIIFITAISTDPRHVFRGYSTGAVDYIAKPFNPDILKSKVSVFIDLHLKTEQIKMQAEQIRQSELREAERRRIEQERELERRHLAELSASEARLAQFKATLDSTLDCVMIFDERDHRFVYANRGALQQLGYQEKAILKLTPMDICSGVPECDFEETLNEIQNGERHALTFETHHRRQDGTETPVEVMVQYIPPADGAPGRFIWIARDSTERKRAEAEIAAAYAREKRIAEVLQRSFLMSPPETAFPGLSVATLYEAAWDEANLGGDFFDAFMIGTDTVALVVGDVTGKGLQAAARTAEVKYSLRAFLRECADPSHTLDRLNRALLTHRDENEAQAFVCLSLVVWDTAQRKAYCSTAGCEPPVLVHNDGSWEAAEVRGLPLGIDIASSYDIVEIAVNPGETIVMVTDGITEARGMTGLFGQEGFTGLFGAANQDRNRSVQEIAHTILSEAKRFAGGRIQDDACLLVARAVGPGISAENILELDSSSDEGLESFTVDPVV